MTNKTLNRIINYIKIVADPESIILFGSFAKGNNNLHSDIDLLLIMEDVYFKNILVNQISHFISELSLRSDVLIHSKKEIEIANKDSFSFLGSIIKEGKIIYTKLR
ncbi:nucleotidyltransferase domain-containing protein [Mariniflexile litorale]|uniref:Nucleotidyltransferase domain-containing protein n=1 Tax=Mariniflexile litorale TaxID=3045158 RepID=A0AAU7EAB2_9FLAO|nr:nucleotidyltransferase domain-containing protein [Mariniflexile sp. KMM 9835]MDQ8213011.1 nucleotidyltransferase domain-containing protein [Mariniflexile sp. KMM 9835]